MASVHPVSALRILGIGKRAENAAAPGTRIVLVRKPSEVVETVAAVLARN